MLSRNDILETIRMIDQQHLDIRTITMGISLPSCADSSAERACEKIYDKISRYAEHLVATGEEIEQEFGIPIVNKRVSVTPIALVAAASETEDYVPFAKALDRAAKNVGVNFIGGFSALVQKGMTDADRKLIAAIPEALACTDLVCSSVNVGSSKAGINMDAVALMGQTVKKTAALTEKQGGFGCAKLVIFCNAVEDNPFMAGAFHGVGEPEKVINVGVSGPGVVSRALDEAKGKDFEFLCETIKRTAFKITRVGQLMLKDMRRDIFTHIQYCRAGSICIILLTELCILLLLVCSNDATGGVDDGTQSVFIEEVYQVCTLTALCAVTGHQDKCLGHYLTKYLSLLRIGCTYHSTYIAVRIAHAVSSPGCDLFSYQLIQRSAIN